MPSRGPIALVEPPSGGFGHKKREDRRADFCPAFPNGFSSLATESFPQRRTGPIKEALHPRTLSTGIVILADRLSRRRWRHGRTRPTLCNIQIAPLVARMQLSVEPQFYAQWLVPHTGLGVAACNRIALPVKGKRVVVGNDPLFDVTQDRGQIQFRRELPMLVGKTRHWPREAFVPLGPILYLQKYVSGFQVPDLGQSQLFDQPVLGC